MHASRRELPTRVRHRAKDKGFIVATEDVRGPAGDSASTEFREGLSFRKQVIHHARSQVHLFSTLPVASVPINCPDFW